VLLPDLLYRLTQRDVGQDWARFYSRFVTAAGLVVGPTVDLATPGDAVVLITQLVIQNIPGAGITYLRSDAVWRPSNVAAGLAHRIVAHHAEVGLAAGVRASLNLQSPCWIPPASIITLTGNFTGAAAVNTIEGHVMGFTLPLGTLLLS